MIVKKGPNYYAQILILLFSQTTKIIKNYGELKYKYKSDHLWRLIIYIYIHL